MLAFRIILKVKPDQIYKAREMALNIKEVAPDWKGRIYTPAGFGPWETIIIEETHESKAEYDAYWEKYNGKPEITAWWDEWWKEVADSGNSSEIWELTEI